ncbi:MAG: flavodoxin [Clostridia bacterium]|nr:flavodoxin [Clostridia bacterium]
MVFLFALVACSGASSNGETQTAPAASAEVKESDSQQDGSSETTSDAPQKTETSEADKQETTEKASEPETGGTKTLVVYFSATGTTKGVAEQIASVTGADIYEITAAQTYTADDLNWNDSESRTTKEQNDKSVRPAIGSDTTSLDDYSVIFIGYPIWWGEEPRIMDTFVESYDFSGKTVIPFCTSGGSGIGSSGTNLEANAGSGNWLEGKRLSGSSDIAGWVDGLGL